MADKILLVGAHPDDYEIGAGMKILSLVRAGIDVYGVTLTDGENSNRGKSRRPEGEKAADMLGLTGAYFLGLPDGRIDAYENQHTALDRLEAIIREIDPSQVYVHSPHDRHQDHRATEQAVQVAARRIGTVMHYKSPSTTKIDPFDIFFEGTEQLLDEKVKIIADAYGSQIDNGGIVNRDRLVTEARFFAQHVRPYARCPNPLEAFFATRNIER